MSHRHISYLSSISQFQESPILQSDSSTQVLVVCPISASWRNIECGHKWKKLLPTIAAQNPTKWKWNLFLLSAASEQWKSMKVLSSRRRWSSRFWKCFCCQQWAVLQQQWNFSNKFQWKFCQRKFFSSIKVLLMKVFVVSSEWDVCCTAQWKSMVRLYGRRKHSLLMSVSNDIL